VFSLQKKIHEIIPLKNSLYRNSFIFFLGTLLSGFATYLFQFLMGRMLSLGDFGSLAALMSFFAILGVPVATLSTVATKQVASLKVNYKDDYLPMLSAFILRLSKIFFLIGIGLCLIFLLLMPSAIRYLRLESSLPYIIMTLPIIFAFTISLWRGVLPALGRFKDLSLNITFESIVKLILGSLFVFLGWRLNGAIFAITLSGALAGIFLFWQLRSIRSHTNKKISLKGFSRIFFFILFWTFATTTLQSTDTILVKRFFSGEETGMYAALSVLGRLIFFAGLAITGVLFPLSIELYESGNHNAHEKLFKKSLFFLLLISLIGIGFYAIFPKLIVRLFFGSSYLSLAPLLPWFGVNAALLSIIQLFATYFLSIGKKYFVFLILFTTLFEWILIYQFHESIPKVLLILTLCFIFLCLLLLANFFVSRYTKNH